MTGPALFVQHDWYRYAACRGADTSIFYPERGRSNKKARAYCARCPVRLACLEVALENREHGVWGDTSARQRRDELRGRKRTVALKVSA